MLRWEAVKQDWEVQCYKGTEVLFYYRTSQSLKNMNVYHEP